MRCIDQGPALPQGDGCFGGVRKGDVDYYPRYEALIELSHRARKRTSVESIAECIAGGWRFCANAAAWRLIVEFDERLLLIDYDCKRICISDREFEDLPAADRAFWKDHIPAHLRHGLFDKSTLEIAEHLKSELVSDIVVLPLDSEERGMRVLALIGSGHFGFSAADLKFVSAVGDLLASEVGYVLTVGKLTQSLRQLANQDALTGIPNRRSFDEKFDKYWRASVRSGEPLSLLIIDVDNFKMYNDHYGHNNGDDCLRAVATTLQSSITRPLDYCARIGGEEFAVLLPATTSGGADKVGELLLAAVRALEIEHVANGGRGIVTTSIGAATVIATRLRSRMELYEAADAALYTAKRGGRDQLRQSAMPEALPVV